MGAEPLPRWSDGHYCPAVAARAAANAPIAPRTDFTIAAIAEDIAAAEVATNPVMSAYSTKSCPLIGTQLGNLLNHILKHVVLPIPLPSSIVVRLLREYPREPFLAAVREAAQYGLYDLDRLERMILRRVARDYFLLLDPDSDSHD